MERFPNVDWYCDRCNSYLNDQDGFDDHKYIWKCKKCGYKNSLSWDNVYDLYEDPRTKRVGYILAFLRALSVYLLIAYLIHFTIGEFSTNPFFSFLGKITANTVFSVRFYVYFIALVVIYAASMLFKK